MNVYLWLRSWAREGLFSVPVFSSQKLGRCVGMELWTFAAPGLSQAGVVSAVTAPHQAGFLPAAQAIPGL